MIDTLLLCLKAIAAIWLIGGALCIIWLAWVAKNAPERDW